MKRRNETHHEKASLLIEGVTQTIENETKEQRSGFLGVL